MEYDLDILYKLFRENIVWTVPVFNFPSSGTTLIDTPGILCYLKTLATCCKLHIT